MGGWEHLRRFPEDLPGLAGAGCVVPAVHPAENPVIQALNPHADTGDTEIEQAPDELRAPFNYIFRIHLYGEFLVVPHRGCDPFSPSRSDGHAADFRKRLHYPTQCRQRQHARSPPSYI